MNLRWSTDGFDRVARDVTGKIVVRIKRRSVGDPMRWVVYCEDGSVAASNMAGGVREAKAAAMRAYLAASV